MQSSKPSLVFVGQRNFFTLFFRDWLSLSQHIRLRGCIWTTSGRKTWKHRCQRLFDRIKKNGVVRSLSELTYNALERRRYEEDHGILKSRIGKLREELQVKPATVFEIAVSSLQDAGVLPFIDWLHPDLLLTQCINEIIPESVFKQPRLGCFVYHEGIVPQYRGKFGTHWAILNGDFDQIGVSLIQVHRGIDTGPVAFTEHVRLQQVQCSHGLLEHEVVLLGLPRLKRWLLDLSEGKLELTKQAERYPLYSYPRYSHLFRIGRKKREYEEWNEKTSNASAGPARPFETRE